jgi:serine/threonine-protein kinase
MSLAVGTKLGPYEILAPIGAGGMGEVYRAHDPRMGRDVAIKIAAEQFSERFSREVRAVAALNHPNICHVYDVGPNYLVMEMVEGPRLADRIQQGAIPLDEALGIAKQIAGALEAAHEKGIVHRDLKPANVKIRPDGTLKVLDFGLAKTTEPAHPSDSENSPTLTLDVATRGGAIMGTAAYMAPEQARGATVDKRADIWAFGVVLYEMLTAKRLFKGETAADTLALVLSKEPDWNAAPSGVRNLLQRCLAKDPKGRLRDIGDAMALVENTPPAAGPGGRMRWLVAGALSVGLVTGAFLYWRLARSDRRPLNPLIRVDIDLGKDVSPASAAGSDAVLSPDGLGLAFVSQGSDGQSHLSTRRLDQSNVTELANTEGAYAPFFSPDGRSVGFFARGKLKRVSIEGGEAITLADAPSGRGASWGENGTIVAALDTRTGLSQLSPAGGAVTRATEFDLQRGEASHRWPQVLPGSNVVLFTASTSTADFDAADIEVASLTDHRIKIVLSRAGTYARFLPSGHLIYVSKGTIFAAPFDLDRLAVRGMPIPILDHISYDPLRGFAQLDISQSGSALYRIGSGTLLRRIQWVDAGGKTETVNAQAANYQFPRLSPDGNRLAASVVNGAISDIWVYDIQRDLPIRLTDGPGVKDFPVWSPDGRRLVFEGEGGTVGMYWTEADGGSKPEKLIESRYPQSPGNFSPDGKRLIYGELNPSGTGSDIRVVEVDSQSGKLRAGKPQVFLSTPSTNPYPAFSPDGRWIAYCSTESGAYEIYVRSFPDSGSKWQVSNTGGMMPVWSRARHEIFYRTEDQRLMVATYTVKDDKFLADKPRLWFRGPLANLGLTANFDLAPDGERFAVLLPAGDTEQPETRNHMTLALDFFDELRRRLPSGK